MRTALGWLAVAGASGMAAYAGMVALTRARYGATSRRPAPGEADELLDRFMPTYEVIERHHVRVGAPHEVTFAAACEMDLRDSPIVRAIFRVRELALAANSVRNPDRGGLLADMKALGWGVLAEIPGREVLLGAVTRPWAPNPVFRALRPSEFAAFSEPGFVKIAWTLRADPIGPNESIARTETRAATTDATARKAFRRYWSFVAPGVVMIRFLALRLVKDNAERHRTQPNALSSVIITANPTMNPSVATSVVPDRTVSGMSSSTTT
jgi:hypothetical protein